MRTIMAALFVALAAVLVMPVAPAKAGVYTGLAQRTAEIDKSTEQVHWRRKRRGIYFSFGYPRHYGYRYSYRPYYYRPYSYSNGYSYGYPRARHYGYYGYKRRWH